MPMRVSGLTSGLDTESIVSALVQSYSTKAEKHTKAQTKLSWTQEAWKSLNTKVYSLYTNVSNLRFSGAYSTKKVNVSDATKAKVTASGEAVVGSQKLKVSQTAQSAYMTGGKVNLPDKDWSESEKKATTMKELGYSGGNTAFELTINGKTEKISINGDTKISEVISKLKDAGVNASFDENQSRFYISAKTSGAAGDFTFKPTIDLRDANGNVQQYNMDSYNALYALGFASSSDASQVFNSVAATNITLQSAQTGSNLEISFETPTSAGMASLQNYLVEQLKTEGNYKVSTTENPDGSVSASYSVNDGFVFENGKIYSTGDTERKNPIGSYTEKTASADLVVPTPSYDAEGNLIEDTITTEGGRKASYVSAGTPSGSVTIETMNTGVRTRFIFTEPASQAQAEAQNAFVKAIHTNGKMRIETGSADANGEIPVTYKMEGFTIADGKVYSNDDLDNPIAVYEDNGSTLVENKYDQKASLTASGGSTASYQGSAVANDKSHEPTKIDGRDAIIELNGVEYTNSSNTFSINGLTIEALAETAEEITVNTSTDTQAIYDKIKDFLTEYNNIINEMNKLYNADSSYGYDPLTDEEKDAMSDTEIEKWEAKIKDSLLRNDTTLNGVMMAMINSMSKSYEIDGEKYSLSSFGIQTLGYLKATKNEEYAYHIDGDADDENSSGNKDKLMAAINEDPDRVINFMKALTSELYTNIGNKMKSTSLSSAYTIYNDKEMNSQYSEYSSLISEWEKKVTEKEDYYYQKFSKMESALTKLQSQTSSLTGLFSS